jgi:hypothetical protein
MRTQRLLVIIAALALSVWGAASCDDEERCSAANEPRCGLLKNQVVVTFQTGTTRAQVDAINAEIGATVLDEPTLTTTYGIRLPEGWCYQKGIDFYKRKPEVVTALFAISLCPDNQDGGTEDGS